VLVGLVALSIVPFVNSLDPEARAAAKAWRTAVFNIDIVRPFVSWPLYSIGVSLYPSKVVVGRNGWLFLGDDYDQIISRRLRPPDSDRREGIEIASAMNAWADHLSARGVQFKFLAVPDKETIYSDRLPRWAAPTQPLSMSPLIGGIAANVAIDATSYLMAASKGAELTYFKTDSHWTNYGAWIGYRALSDAWQGAGIEWLSANDVVKVDPTDWAAGDLSRILFLRKFLRDQNFEVQLKNRVPLASYNFDTGEQSAVPNSAELGAPLFPLRVVSSAAKNKKRVIWLRDSFGSAMSPYMTATFSEMIQLHYDKLLPGSLDKLIDRFQPDIVVVTVVQRALRHEVFKYKPLAN
jgi:hypothetical protein